MNKNEFFGHPKGLFILFLTETWERFSYYGMRAILVLYLVAQTNDNNAGLGWEKTDAFALYGWYTMLVYVMGIVGGILADKVFGRKKMVMIGGILLCLGHGILAVEQMWAFYLGLILIILGVGGLKPNISTMVGELYKQGDIRRDKGFTIFYIGINVGAFLSALIVGYVGEEWGWHYGFGLAGIGMILGQIVYIYGQRYLKDVGNIVKHNPEEEKSASILGLFKDLLKTKLQLVLSLILLVFSLYFLSTSKDANDVGYGLLFVFLSATISLLMMVYKDLASRIQKDRYIVMLLSYFLVIVFFGAFEQAGGLMNVFAKEKTDRIFMGYEIPATWFQSLNPLFIIALGSLVASFWAIRRLKSKEASSIFKMAIGIVIMGLGFVFMSMATLEYDEYGSSSMYWLVLAYLFHTVGELSLSPVSLSFITKLAPVKYASLMMGVYFAFIGLGNKVAGYLGESSSKAGELSIFSGIAIFTILFSTIIILLIKPLKRLTHGVESNEK